METQIKPDRIALIYKTAILYAFFSQLVATVSVDITRITRGLVIPAFNWLVIRALLPKIGVGLLADLAIGAVLGLVFYGMRERIFHQKNGILLGFAVLALVSLVITLGPSIGMHLTLAAVLRILLVYLVRDLLTILVVFYWVRPPHKNSLDRMKEK